jgi:hypothetical protein
MNLTPRQIKRKLSDVSAYGTNQRDYLRKGFWRIAVTEANADETEIAEGHQQSLARRRLLRAWPDHFKTTRKDQTQIIF